MSTAVRIAELEQQNAQLSEQLATLSADHAMLRRQLDWFKRQLFGAKSEKQLFIDPAVQGNLLATLGVATPPPPPITPTTTVTYARKKRRDNAVTDTGLRFDETVPVNIITIGDPAIEALPESARECIGEKVTYRLAQRPASYEMMKYVRKVYKIVATQAIVTTISPPTVLEKCVADVSLLAGILTDKFLYHLPLYRQHQRINAAGIQVSRGSLTNWSSRAIDLLEPIYVAQFSHVLLSRVLAMDETPIKAGHREKGKMRQGYFWPIHGEDNEVVFPFATSRAHSHAQSFLGSFTGTLVSDGYAAYAAYAKNNTEVTHAECWAHYPDMHIIWRGSHRLQQGAAERRLYSQDKTGDLQGVEEGEQVRLGFPGSGTYGRDPSVLPKDFQCIAFRLWICCEVSTCRRDTGMPEIVADHRNIAARLEQRDRATVTQHMRGDSSPT